MKKLGLALALAATELYAQNTEDVTTLDAIEVLAPAVKEETPIAERPSASTSFNAKQMEAHKIDNLKTVAEFTPNLHNPDYGSKTTSSIFVRGIGSRMDQPAVGLYVDGIPYMNKSAFDFNLSSIRNIYIARGPQGTLYGRNTMAGIVDISTQLPDLDSPRTTIEAGYGTFNKAGVVATHYNHVKKVAFSANGYFDRNDGHFTNAYNQDDIGKEWNAGGRVNLTYKKGNFNSLFTTSFDHDRQEGYAYAQLDSLGMDAGIDYNDDCYYERDLLASGLKLEYAWPNYIISSATSFQYIDDDMLLDNDFTRRNIFTLQQLQSEKTITEEIVLKSNLRNGQFKHYAFLTGISGFYRNLNIEAPVLMKDGGIESLIERNVNNVPALKRMGMSLDIANEDLPIGTSLGYPSKGIALFHQSTINANEKLTFEVGIRADYEQTHLDYDSHLETYYTFPPMINRLQTVTTAMHGSVEQDFLEFLPKFTAKYMWEKGVHTKMMYATVSKGYKSGGYNTQMMSDILQYQMQKDLKEDLYTLIPDNIGAAKDAMKPILLGMPNVDAKEVLEYKPEYSWNYEIGTKLSFEKINAEGALFFIDCRDQQVTVFSNLGGMGRMTKNAGHTQSYGAEISVNYKLTDWLTMLGNYGYTHASFKDYQINDSTNYKGNRVAFAPEQTYLLGVSISKMFDKIGIFTSNIDFSGTGNIYWTDDNSIKEGHHGLLSANIGFTPSAYNKLTVSVWGKNLTDCDYNTFYFESMGNKFIQKGKPLQVGLKVKLKL